MIFFTKSNSKIKGTDGLYIDDSKRDDRRAKFKKKRLV